MIGPAGRRQTSEYMRAREGRHTLEPISKAASYFFFQAEDGIRDLTVTGVQTCALPISCSNSGAKVPGPAQPRSPPSAADPGSWEVVWARPAKSSPLRDRKSTRLNSSHSQISYAVFCLTKKNTHTPLIAPGPDVPCEMPRP